MWLALLNLEHAHGTQEALEALFARARASSKPQPIYMHVASLYERSNNGPLADATYQAKYGIQARSGGGRASARETIGRVAAGAIAKQLLNKANGTEVVAWVRRIHDIEAQIDPAAVTLDAVESNIVRCPDGAVGFVQQL